MREVSISKKLTEYFSKILGESGKLGFLPHGATFVQISDIRRLSGSDVVYSFSLTYREMGHEKQSNLVLKAYVKALEPVLNNLVTYESFSRLSYTYPQLYCENSERCLKEFQVLSGLESVGFPVPRAYLFELDSNVLGYPFIIMLKEEPIQNSTFNIDYFAKNLARLHNLDVATLGLDALKAPEDEYDFAKRSLLYLKILLNLLPTHDTELKNDFESAIRCLEANASNTRCPKYCLLHGDYRARINTFLTKDSRMVVMDWESAEIGDPAFDVGYAYARMLVDFDKKTADRFVKEYLRYFDGDFAQRLLFYKLAAHLRLALLHNSILSNPLTGIRDSWGKSFSSVPISPFAIYR